jgi:hypothetical protein
MHRISGSQHMPMLSIGPADMICGWNIREYRGRLKRVTNGVAIWKVDSFYKDVCRFTR